MYEIFQAGGWIMWPLLLCSLLTVVVFVDRMLALRKDKVVPPKLTETVWSWIKNDQVDDERLRALHNNSPLGRVLAAGLVHRNQSTEVIKSSIEDTGRHVVHEMEKYLNSLGTVAETAPLLGLLGTVWGMIKVFSAIVREGVGDPSVLAGGISQALVTTAAGLLVAIIAKIAYRYLHGRVSVLVVDMEKEAIRLLQSMNGKMPLSGVEPTATKIKAG